MHFHCIFLPFVVSSILTVLANPIPSHHGSSSSLVPRGSNKPKKTYMPLSELYRLEQIKKDQAEVGALERPARENPAQGNPSTTGKQPSTYEQPPRIEQKNAPKQSPYEAVRKLQEGSKVCVDDCLGKITGAYNDAERFVHCVRWKCQTDFGPAPPLTEEAKAVVQIYAGQLYRNCLRRIMDEKGSTSQLEKESCRRQSLTFGIEPPPDSAYYSKLEPLKAWNQLKDNIGRGFGQATERLGHVLNSVHGSGRSSGGRFGGAATPVPPSAKPIFIP